MADAAPAPGGQHRAGPAPASRSTRDSIGRRSYAALDLGTNNCRLLIARPAEAGFVVVDAFSRIVRLGEGLGRTGRLSQAAMDRTVTALSVCADKLGRRHVSMVRSVATEACRRAANGREFVERVFDETGIALDVISPAEEAHLAVMGCHSLLESGDGPALVFDIGGGSTELVLIDTSSGDPAIRAWHSAPWGVVSLAEAEADHHPTEAGRLAAYERMRARVREALADFAVRLTHEGERPVRLMGTSGTVTTLTSVHLGLPAYDRRKVDGAIVPAPAMREISARLAALSVPDRALLPCIGGERADLVVAGCAILEAILDIWPAERLTVADRGIREGILRRLMARDGHRI